MIFQKLLSIICKKPRIFRKQSKKRPFRFIIFSISAVFLLYSLWFYITLPEVEWLKNKNPQKTALMEQRIAEAKESGKKYKIRQKWVSFKKIPKLLRQSIRISEDASFYRHNGLDFTEIGESIKRNLAEGKIARGASTISQQLAKNLYLSTDKSYMRKFREYFITKRLEKHLSKYRIFHLYLNVIEFGRGIFGVQAASYYYYKKSVSSLSLAEMVKLAAVIPKPLKERPTKKTRWLKWKAGWILKKLKQYKYISKEVYEKTKPNI